MVYGTPEANAKRKKARIATKNFVKIQNPHILFIWYGIDINFWFTCYYLFCEYNFGSITFYKYTFFTIFCWHPKYNFFVFFLNTTFLNITFCWFCFFSLNITFFQICFWKSCDFWNDPKSLVNREILIRFFIEKPFSETIFFYFVLSSNWLLKILITHQNRLLLK